MAYLYAVTIERGESHSQWSRLYSNLMELNAKTLDFTGHWNICAVKHHMDAETVRTRIASGIKDKETVQVEEVTRDTLEERHRGFNGIYDRYYSPYDEFPNID